MIIIVMGMGNIKRRKGKSKIESKDEEELTRRLEETARILGKIPGEKIVGSSGPAVRRGDRLFLI